MKEEQDNGKLCFVPLLFKKKMFFSQIGDSQCHSLYSFYLILICWIFKNAIFLLSSVFQCQLFGRRWTWMWPKSFIRSSSSSSSSSCSKGRDKSREAIALDRPKRTNWLSRNHRCERINYVLFTNHRCAWNN